MTLLLETEPTIQRHGAGELRFSRVDNKTAVTRATASSPLRLLTPTNSGPAAWAFISSYGGGLVAGDHLDIDIHAEPHTTAYISTQSSTKIYQSANGRGCRQSLRAKIDDNALLVLTPDPLICFKSAHYTQSQHFHLAPSAGLVLLDWFTSGRHARGERWQFSHFESRNEIFLGQKKILIDALRLSRTDGPLTDPLRMGNFNCFATLILVGNRVASHAKTILDVIAKLPVVPNQPLLVSASPLVEGMILRLAATRTEDAAWFLYQQLAFLADLLGEHPWQRKW